MEKVTICQFNYDDLRRAFRDEMIEEFYAKYNDTYISTAFVMELCGVQSKDTITNWIKQGKIYPINRGARTYKFRLSDILRNNPKHRQINSIVLK
jgi:hypothetical protein